MRCRLTRHLPIWHTKHSGYVHSGLAEFCQELCPKFAPYNPSMHSPAFDIRRHCNGFLVRDRIDWKFSHLWNGSQAKQLIQKVCPFSVPLSSPEEVFQMWIIPFLSAEASLLPSGDQAMARTQFLCAVQVRKVVSVLTSQNRTVVSPDPEASEDPSGLKHTDTMASVCPAIDPLHLVIDWTWNTACGAHTISKHVSNCIVPLAKDSIVSTSVDLISESLRKNKYGVSFSWSVLQISCSLAGVISIGTSNGEP